MTAMAQISNEYAEALFALALEAGQVREYSEALDIVLNLMNENPEYLDFLASPDIPRQERVDAVENVFGGSIPETVVSFLCLLCDRGRIHTLKDCISDYKKLSDAADGVSTAEVISAVELAENEKAALKSKLEALCGHKIELDCSVDESLIGGVKVTVDGKVIDGSVKQKLHELKGAMYR